MGIDVHSFNFLRYALRMRGFGSVATLGRQSLLVSPTRLSRMLHTKERFGLFCEELLLRHFGATVVHSYDYSDFEGATHIVDMNDPITPAQRYDTVLDLGCIEHIFDVVQA